MSSNEFSASEGEEEEEEERAPPKSRKRTRNDAAADRASVRHVQPQAWVAGHVATLMHLPHGVSQLMLAYLNDADVLAFRLTCLYAQEAAWIAMGARALARFGHADPMAIPLAAHFARLRETELNKGDSKAAFRLRDADLESIPFRVEHHRRWSQYFYPVEELLRAAIKRHGSVREIFHYDAKLSRSQATIKRSEKLARRRALYEEMATRGINADSLESNRALAKQAQKWVSKGHDGGMEAIIQALQGPIDRRRAVEQLLGAPIESRQRGAEWASIQKFIRTGDGGVTAYAQEVAGPYE